MVAPAERSKLGEGRKEILDQKEATKYRGLVARFNYVGQDRSDIQFAVKELGSAMANPTTLDLVKVKRCIRYLLGAPRCCAFSISKWGEEYYGVVRFGFCRVRQEPEVHIGRSDIIW